MPIRCRTAKECFEVFRTHTASVVGATITTQPILGLKTTGQKTGTETMTIGFRQGAKTVGAPIETRFGRLYFYLGQLLAAPEEEDGMFRLRTHMYWYRLQASADLKSQALIRWEYDGSTKRDGHARHHAQMPTTLPVGSGVLDFDKAHLPTGWVTFEEVIRFLITDLGVTPLCGDSWPGIIEASEKKFYEDFTGKRYKPPS